VSAKHESVKEADAEQLDVVNYTSTGSFNIIFPPLEELGILLWGF